MASKAIGTAGRALGASSRARGAADEEVVLARRGIGGYRQYRIPALVAAKSPAGADVLIAAWDGRYDLDDLPAPIDLVIRRSFDGGSTWGEQQIVRSGTGFEGFGDPSLVVDESTGEIHIFHAAGVYAGFFESGEATSNEDPHIAHVDLATSRDGGETFTHRRLTEQLRTSGNAHLDGARIAGIFASSGTGCQLRRGPAAGRLLQSFVLRVSGRIRVAVGYSDDHGATWQLGAPIVSAEELNESSVCELADGTVVLHSRGVGHRLAAISTDGGLTFAPARPTELADPGVNGSVIAAGNLLFASHSADRELRRAASISVSDDGGATWRLWRTLTPGSAGYTQLALLPGERLGVIYEADGYRQIRFASFELPKGFVSAEAATNETATNETTSRDGWLRVSQAGIVLDLVLRSVTPARPSTWLEVGEAYRIDLAQFAHVDPATFKEIHQDASGGSVQVVRGREALEANLGPAKAGIHAGDVLDFNTRVAVAAHACASPTRLRWGGESRELAGGAVWLRRDIHHVVTEAEAKERVATVSCAVIAAATGADEREVTASLAIDLDA